jgi:hypothetical protein
MSNAADAFDMVRGGRADEHSAVSLFHAAAVFGGRISPTM